jgi:hypothetical protein
MIYVVTYRYTLICWYTLVNNTPPWYKANTALSRQIGPIPACAHRSGPWFTTNTTQMVMTDICTMSLYSLYVECMTHVRIILTSSWNERMSESSTPCCAASPWPQQTQLIFSQFMGSGSRPVVHRSSWPRSRTRASWLNNTVKTPRRPSINLSQFATAQPVNIFVVALNTSKNRCFKEASEIYSAPKSMKIVYC